MFNTAGYVVAAIIGLIQYAFIAYCVQAIGRRRGARHPWFAWIPLLNVFLLCRITTKRLGWAILLTFLVVLPTSVSLPFPDTIILPTLAALMMIILFAKVSHACGRTRWLGLLIIVPLVNLVLLWVLAFVSPQKKLAVPPPLPSAA